MFACCGAGSALFCFVLIGRLRFLHPTRHTRNALTVGNPEPPRPLVRPLTGRRLPTLSMLTDLIPAGLVRPRRSAAALPPEKRTARGCRREPFEKPTRLIGSRGTIPMDHLEWQDEQCRAKHRPGHRCHDKHGAPFASPERGPRPGSVCWFEQISRLEDQRVDERALVAGWLRALDDATSIEQLVTL